MLLAPCSGYQFYVFFLNLQHQEELERRNQQLHELQHKTEVLARRLDEKEKQLNEQQEEVKLMQDAVSVIFYISIMSLALVLS